MVSSNLLPSAAKMIDRLKKVIHNRLVTPSGRCVSANVEISDLNLINGRPSLISLEEQLMNRIDKMYHFCNLKKKQKVKENVLKIINRLKKAA